MSIKKGIVYILIANFVHLCISLITGFVLPKLLSIDSYANVKLFQLYITYVGVLSLGFADGMYLRFGGKKKVEINEEEFFSEFKTYKVFQLFISVICVIFSLFLKDKIIFFCALSILPVNISGYLRNFYQAIGEFKKYSKFMNINTIILFIINMFLALIIKTDVYIIYVFCYFISYILYCMFIEFETRKILKYKEVNKAKIYFNRKYLVEDIKSGILLMLGNFCNVIFTTIDRIFVKNLINLTNFAYYSFAVSIENLLTIFITPITSVMYNYFCKNNDLNKIIDIKRYILLFSSIIILIIFPIKFIVEIWIDKYIPSLNVLFLLVGAQYISIMIKTIHINLYKARKEQKKYFKIMVSVIVISIILNVIGFVINKSSFSIALATLITNIIWFIIGEFDLKYCKLLLKDYIYIFIMLISFLICGMLLDSLVGLLTYVIILALCIFLFERKIFFKLIDDLKDFLVKKLNKEIIIKSR